MLKDEGRGDGLAVFSHCHDCVTNIKFSHDSRYLATSVSKLLANRVTDRQIVSQSESHTDRQTGRETDRQTDRLAGRQTDRPTGQLNL